MFGLKQNAAGQEKYYTKKMQLQYRWNMDREQQITLFLKLPFQHWRRHSKHAQEKMYTAQPKLKEFKMKLEKLKLRSLIS